MSYECSLGQEFEPEEIETLDFLLRISSILNDQIEMKRGTALSVLVNPKKSAKVKQEELNRYFAFRMDPKRYIAFWDGKEYTLDDLVEKATWLFHIYNSFIEDIKSATDSRNNASHGGSEISLEQCKKDKLPILAEIAELHDKYIGLIQKLVDIFTYSQVLPHNSEHS